MSPGTHIDHPKFLTLFKFVPQKRCEVEVAEVIGAHLHLEAISSHFPFGNRHHTSVVYEYVYLFGLLLYLLGKLLYRALVA